MKNLPKIHLPLQTPWPTALHTPPPLTPTSPPPATTPQSHAGGRVYVVASQPHNETQRKRPKYTRSKTGCLTCRVKKIKCDETRPICMRCTHGQRDCTWSEGAPTRKKATPRKEYVDGWSSTADCSDVSEASTPSIRDSASQDDYSLPPVVVRRHSEPFLPPLEPNPELARRQIAPHPYQPHHPSQDNVLSMVPEMPPLHSYHPAVGGSSSLTAYDHVGDAVPLMFRPYDYDNSVNGRLCKRGVDSPVPSLEREGPSHQGHSSEQPGKLFASSVEREAVPPLFDVFNIEQSRGPAPTNTTVTNQVSPQDYTHPNSSWTSIPSCNSPVSESASERRQALALERFRARLRRFSFDPDDELNSEWSGDSQGKRKRENSDRDVASPVPPTPNVESAPGIGNPSLTSDTISHSPFPLLSAAQTTQTQAPLQTPSPLQRDSPPKTFNFPSSPKLHCLPDGALDPPGLLAEANLAYRKDQEITTSSTARPIDSDSDCRLDVASDNYSRSGLHSSVEPPCETSNFSANYPPPPDLTHYIIKTDDQYIAGGGFGDVYKCRYLDSVTKEVAVKAFRFTSTLDGHDNDRSVKMLRRELGIWRRLNHPNVVPFLGIAYGFGMRGAMSLVSPWMPNESLSLFLAKHGDHLELGHRLQFLQDVVHGLHYLHSFPIVHGDLNCNNVLLDADYTARLADFGYASLVGNIPEALTYLQRSTVRPGALRWIAPEQIESEMFSRTPKSDIYSFGCVTLQVLTGRQPWSEVREDAAVVLRLARGHKPGRPVSRVMDDSHWDFIQECWSSIDSRPVTDVIIPIIQGFSRQCTPVGSLSDLF